MRILFIADGRSPTALNWIRYWTKACQEVHLISSFPCDRPKHLKTFHILPIAFASFGSSQVKSAPTSSHQVGSIGALRGLLLRLRYYLGPLSLLFFHRSFTRIVAQIDPDIVHALRIPFEGMLAANLPTAFPLVVSTWGNDLTLHAHGSPLMTQLTRNVLERADSLITDTRRDLELGHHWGMAPEKPSMVIPGSGGIQKEEMLVSSEGIDLPEELPDGFIVVNPRGQRPSSLRQDIFLKAIPLVLKKIPQATFVCPSLAGDSESEHLVNILKIRSQVKLWPRLTQKQLWTLFQRSHVYVSPSIHDGTPNSLLETMSLGCFPVVGNIESLQEWIINGTNGLLIDALDANSIATAIIQALSDSNLRASAAQYNAALINDRADLKVNMKKVEGLYQKLCSCK